MPVVESAFCRVVLRREDSVQERWPARMCYRELSQYVTKYCNNSCLWDVGLHRFQAWCACCCLYHLLNALVASGDVPAAAKAAFVHCLALIYSHPHCMQNRCMCALLNYPGNRIARAAEQSRAKQKRTACSRAVSVQACRAWTLRCCGELRHTTNGMPASTAALRRYACWLPCIGCAESHYFVDLSSQAV